MNPARRLYERLGFRIADDQGICLFMEWRPIQRLSAPLQPENLLKENLRP